jgi:hypothetical protein
MKRTLNKTLLTLAIAIAGATTSQCVGAQNNSQPSLEDQLKTQYKITKFSWDSSGVVVIDPETVLVVQKGGILGVPPANLTLGTAVYKDGELHPPSTGQRMFLGNVTRLLDVGEKVYVAKTEVNLKKDRISFTIVECDSCNGANQPSSYKAIVAFDYPKGYLSSADPGQVEDVIDQVLSPDKGGSDNSQQDQSGEQQAPPPAQAQAAPAQPPPQAPAAQPETIQAGQTPDQVKAILGEPDKIVSLGSKTIFVYKDLKVTFVNGKVTDAE